MNFLKNKIEFKKIFGIAFLMIAIMIVFGKTSNAAINPMVKFEGKVTNLDGSELADGVYDFNFSLYDQATGGAALWTENLTGVNMFSADIDAVTLNADSITYDYTGALATSTLRVGQYLFNDDTLEAALIIDFDAGAGTITVASGSPEWTISDAINNRPFVTGGVIDINLGSVADLSPVDFNQQLYLQVTFNGEVMQPRKNVAAVYQAFESARLGGQSADEFASLADNETITGQWNFNNILTIATSTDLTALTITQNGNGKIVEFNSATGTAFAVFADGRVQIGNYYFPATHGLPGYVLKTDLNGNMYWGMDFAGSGGGAGMWATSTDPTYGDFIYGSDTALDLIIGNNNLTGPASTRFEVEGLAWFDTVGMSAQNQLQFYDADSSNYFALRATSTLGGNFVLTLPASLGAPGQALLTNADGNLYWGSPSGFTYVNAGTTGQIPYYAGNGSVLSATSTIFISPSGNVGIGTITPTQLLTVGQTSGSQFIVNALGQVLNGTWQGSQISALYGGTGLTNFSAGSLLYASAPNNWSALASTTSGYVLQLSSSGYPEWVSTTTLAIAAGNLVGILPVSSGGTGWGNIAVNSILLGNGTNALATTSYLSELLGGTGHDSYVTGDLLYAGDANTLTRLAAGGIGEILVVSSSGIPDWVSTSSLNIEVSTITGILDTAQGGTGQNFSVDTGFIYLNSGTALASNTIAIARTDLAVGSGIILTDHTLTLDPTGNWSGTFDNQDGTYYLNAINLNNFTTPFAWAMSGTTTDALAQGIVNKYYSNNLFAASLAGTTTSALAEGTNLYWTDQRFDTRLSATTSLLNLTVLANLGTVGTITTGTWQGNTLGVAYGGTGTTTFNANSVLYASAADTIGEILAGGDGYVLKMMGGAPVWQPDLTTGGETNFWATSSADNLLIHPATISQVVVIGALSTSTTGRIFEVAGDSLFGGGISAQSLSLVNALAVAYGGTGSSTPSGILVGDGAGNIVSLTNNSNNWNTAYSWGDHSTQNYFVKGVDVASVAMGGTGTTTFQANSLVFASAANTIGEIRAGVNGYALVMENGVPTWSSTTPGVAHGLLSAQHSDAEATTTEQGDLMSVDSSGKWNRLALGADGYILRSNGTDASWMSTVNITSLGTITSGVWNGSPIDIAYGGTGATNTTSARENLGLTDAYNFGITSTGTTGWLWQSDGDGRGRWIATTSLGFVGGGSSYDTLVGTTTYTSDGSISTSTLVGYQAANNICQTQFPGSHFCRTHEILYTIELKDISGWGNDISNAWIAEGPPGYTYDSNDCNGYTDALSTKLGAFWLFNSNGGGAGWLVNCAQVKSLACCKVQ